MITDLNEQINILHLEQKEYEKENIRDKYELLNKFISKIQNDTLTDIEKNELYRSVIDCIIWTRVHNNIDIQIKFK